MALFNNLTFAFCDIPKFRFLTNTTIHSISSIARTQTMTMTDMHEFCAINNLVQDNIIPHMITETEDDTTTFTNNSAPTDPQYKPLISADDQPTEQSITGDDEEDDPTITNPSGGTIEEVEQVFDEEEEIFLELTDDYPALAEDAFPIIYAVTAKPPPEFADVEEPIDNISGESTPTSPKSGQKLFTRQSKIESDSKHTSPRPETAEIDSAGPSEHSSQCQEQYLEDPEDTLLSIVIQNPPQAEDLSG